MMWNHDNYYFEVEGITEPKLSKLSTRDVISLTVDEEMSQMDGGSISFHDDRHVYSRLFAPTDQLKIRWGIRRPDTLFIKPRELTVMVMAPSGTGAAGGNVTFNMNFMAVDQRGIEGTYWHETGTKEKVVMDTFDRLGVSKKNTFVDFRLGSQAINDGTKVAQWESDFRFLVRAAFEWGALFRMGYDQKGNVCGMFCDPDKTGDFSDMVAGRKVLSLNYGSGGFKGENDNIVSYKKNGGGGPNVLQYSWKNSTMNAAMGDGTMMHIGPDGLPVLTRYIVGTEKFETWRLVPERIEEELASRPEITDKTALMGVYLKKKTFEEVRKYFDVVPGETAPQGSGLEVDVKLMGDPLVTAAMQCDFGIGFPDRIGAKDRKWYVKKSTHSMSASGYFTDIQIVDAYSFSSSGQVLGSQPGVSR